MRFTFKVFFCTIAVIAIALGFGGAYLVNSLFSAAMQRETVQAMEENNILRFAFETAAMNVPLKYGHLQDKTIEEIAAILKTGRYIRVSGEDQKLLYMPEGLDADSALLNAVTGTTQACRIIKSQGHYYMHTATSVNAMERFLYLETFKDISSLFDDRDTGFAIYQNITLLTLLCGTVLMSLISFWLTRPVRILSATAKGIASGNYSIRAKRVSKDELGCLSDDFNTMADALESQISELREATESRERFVAAFAHELKTPLTSIVGYADLLRSRKLGEENHFMSTNYIYTEGKRLEKLSLRLLDIIVLKNRALEKRVTHVSDIFSAIEDTFRSEQCAEVVIGYDEAVLKAEAGLLVTALMNIVENAVKASDPGNRVEITGRVTGGGYRFSVRDYGCGIPADEIGKLTQAFYMVDKSRSRSRHGVGLGLTLCADILALHGSTIEFDSMPGVGTEISFMIKCE